MTTVDYIDLLNGTARAAGIAPDDASGEEFPDIQIFHRDRLKRIWEYRPWSILKPTEKRYFRDLYAAQSYVATNEVYYPGPRKYYQALTTAPSNQAPATLSGTTWTTNIAYWAESFTSYSADEYSATHAYAQGDKAYYSLTDRVYQLFAATSTGNAPSDSTKWGVLTEFDRYIAFEQTGKAAFDHAFAAWDKNPKTDGRARRMQAWQSDLGLQVLDDEPFVWLEYRLQRPLLAAEVFDDTAVYAVGDQVYYDSATARGNLYECVTVTAAGQTPESAAAKWSLIEIPAAFETYLIHGAAADYLNADEEFDRRDREESLADEDLIRQTLLHDAQVATLNRTQVGVR